MNEYTLFYEGSGVDKDVLHPALAHERESERERVYTLHVSSMGIY